MGAAFWPLALVFVGGFPIRQGMLLGLLMAWLTFGIGKRATEPVRQFTPYYVSVLPKWYQLLPDFKLVNGLEEWRSIVDSAKSSNSVLREGIWFTVIQQGEDLELPAVRGTLIYLNQHQQFTSKLRFSEDMVPIRIKREDDLSGALSEYQPVELFMDEYTLGIEVPDWWWRRVRGSCPTPVEEYENPLTGYVKLVLATIPYSEFDLYWQPTAATWHEYFRNIVPKIKRRRDKQREELGWTTKERDDRREPEYIDHRYFEVRHRDI